MINIHPVVHNMVRNKLNYVFDYMYSCGSMPNGLSLTKYCTPVNHAWLTVSWRQAFKFTVGLESMNSSLHTFIHVLTVYITNKISFCSFCILKWFTLNMCHWSGGRKLVNKLITLPLSGCQASWLYLYYTLCPGFWWN